MTEFKDSFREARYRLGLAMIERMNRGLKEKPSSDHSDFYDERGLPKSDDLAGFSLQSSAKLPKPGS